MPGYRWKRKNKSQKNTASQTQASSDAVEVPATKKFRQDTEERHDYTPTPKENAAFEAYYRAQGIVREEEWDAFMAALRRPLPTTFRITSNRQVATWIRDQLLNRYGPELIEGTSQIVSSADDGSESVPSNSSLAPTLINWYPDSLAFQLSSDRKTLRTNPAFEKFHQFLVAITNNGDISRQEAVSMIPPLLMNIQPHHLVLDMCAAPGSKTAQLIEMLHRNGDTLPTGMVIANDVNQQRAYMLHHQVKRILSPALLVTNNDGSHFPNIFPANSSSEPKDYIDAILFDRVLCDVPCSGDGTLRKNLQLWGTWQVNLGLGLHAVQLRLLERALQMTKPGGRVVYSTCSLNPIENEAVVGAIMAKYPKNSLSLVDVSQELPELIRESGLTSWKVIGKTGSEYDCIEQIPESDAKRYPTTVFPKEEYKDLGLEKCVRILPHKMDTGGFFIAVIEKLSELSNNASEQRRRKIASKNPKETATEKNSLPIVETNVNDDQILINDEPNPNMVIAADLDPAEIEAPALLVSNQEADKESNVRKIRSKQQQEPFILVDQTHQALQTCFAFYQIDQAGLAGGFLARSERDPIKSLNFISPAVKNVLSGHNYYLKIINCGIRAFEHYDVRGTGLDRFKCGYRLLMESVGVMLPLLAESERLVKVTSKALVQLLKCDNSLSIDGLEFSDEIKLQLNNLTDGGLLLIGKDETIPSSPTIAVPCWKNRDRSDPGKERGLLKAFVPKENRTAMLLQLGEQLALQIEKDVKENN